MKGGKGNGYISGGRGSYGTQLAQRPNQANVMMTVPPSWKVEQSSAYSLDQYHKDVNDWHRLATHLDPATKMDMIVNQLWGTAQSCMKYG